MIIVLKRNKIYIRSTFNCMDSTNCIAIISHVKKHFWMVDRVVSLGGTVVSWFGCRCYLVGDGGSFVKMALVYMVMVTVVWCGGYDVL